METIYLSEWKLYICRFEPFYCGKLLWKRRRFCTISESKLHIFPQLPNGNYIFFHSFQIKALYFSTASEWKLYLNTIYESGFRNYYNILWLSLFSRVFSEWKLYIFFFIVGKLLDISLLDIGFDSLVGKVKVGLQNN